MAVGLIYAYISHTCELVLRNCWPYKQFGLISGSIIRWYCIYIHRSLAFLAFPLHLKFMYTVKIQTTSNKGV
jgi:hypothetical protein